jgi:O-6-methylguanine DNA methyltransferase
VSKKIYIHKFKTGLGRFRLAATEKGLAIIDFTNSREFDEYVKKLFGNFCIKKSGGPINKQAEKEIKSYLSGRLKKFSLKLDVTGTPFQKRVLHEVASIPCGQTMTYGRIAELIGHPGAARAVGSANARNLLPIVIPCHRVLAVNGLGGYAGGLKIKRYLLDLENAEY